MTSRPAPDPAGAPRCPLCGAPVKPEEVPCHGCPLGQGCEILCCARCGYRSLEKSWTLDLFSRLLDRLRGRRGTVVKERRP